MHEAVRHALYEIAVPLPIAALFALAARLFLAKGRPAAARMLYAAAVIVPMPVAFMLSNGRPTESWEQLVWLSAAGGLVGLVGVWRVGRVLVVVEAVALAAVVTVVLWRAVAPEPSWAVRLAPGVSAGLLFVLLAAGASRFPPRVVLLAVWAAAVVSGLGVVRMGQLSMGAAIAPIGASVLAIALVMGRDSREAVNTAVLAPIAAALAATPGVAWMWAKAAGVDYGLWLPTLLPFGVIAAGVIALMPLRNRGPRLRAVIAPVSVLLVGFGILTAMTLLVRAGDEDDLGDIPDFMKYPMD